MKRREVLDLQREHIALLNGAVEVFAGKPELFRQSFDWSGDTTVTILRSEVWHGTLREDRCMEKTAYPGWYAVYRGE